MVSTEALSAILLGASYALLPIALIGQALDSLPPGVSFQMIEEGNAIFHGKGMCVNCHGADATGVLGPDLTDSEWLQAKGSYLEILQVILAGVSESESSSGVAMPPRGGSTISDVDVQAVAGYVWKLSHPEAADSLPHGVTPTLVDRGDEVFHGAGGCFRCHGVDATGDVGPDLTDANWLHAQGTYLAILGQIMAGVPQARSSRGIPMPPRGGANLTNAEVQAVAAYVWYLSHRSP